MSDTVATTPSVTPGDGSTRSGVPIRFDGVTKRYPGTAAAAVDDVTFDIPAGEIVVLVGPSGCGKTTTMRMVNRMIEPTSGEVLIDGKNVMGLNGDKLRRGIGYVIQQVGLFPHMTIGHNIGLVPKLLDWDKKRVSDRVDQLLDLVGLDPAIYRERYPRQLSGGQQQRIGVARALAADPPVLLMDEPFGAVDPITRGHLQDELLRIQADLGKTVVFVTHDFDEAIKLGDRIAVMREGSRFAQYDTPEAILADPADDFVAGFVGRGAALKRLNLMPVGEAELRPVPSDAADLPRLSERASLHDALDTMLEHGDDSALVVDRDGKAVGLLPLDAVLDVMRADSGAGSGT
ncbi:MAG: ABC transporter ATP-binding protein [Actinomycetes bacterium]